MKKKMEVYFVIYLSLLVSFIAIEDELIEYMDRQENILLEVAHNETNKMIRVDSSSSDEAGGNYRVNLALGGDYISESLVGNVLLVERGNRDSDTLVLELRRDLQKGANWYHFDTTTAIFDGQKTFKGILDVTVTPDVSESLITEWEHSFGDHKVAEILAEKISTRKSIQIKHEVPFYLTNRGVVIPVTINFAQEKVTAIKGLRWSTPLFINGVNKPEDYSLEFQRGGNLASVERIGNRAVFTGRARSDGRIIVDVEKFDDNSNARAILDLHVIEPQWRDGVPAPEQMYLAEEQTYMGSLVDIETSITKILVEGDCYPRQELDAVGVLEPCNTPGKIYLTPMVDGERISSLRHEISVVPPPPPEIIETGKNGNTLLFNIVIHGKRNGLKGIYEISGISGQVSERDSTREGSFLSIDSRAEIRRPSTGSVQEVNFIVTDQYGKSTEYKERFEYN